MSFLVRKGDCMRWIKMVAVLMGVFILLIAIDSVTMESASQVNNDNKSIVDEVVFPHDQVVDVFITIDEDTYTNMNENAMSEEIVMADIIYNGYSFNSVGIRTKGNSSLRFVANSESIRYSFKVDLDYYIGDQSLFGVSKLNINNLYGDATMISEYLGYEMMAELDADASRTTYVALYINGEYFGIYLSVEQVNETFLKEHYGNANGELYKPDMGIGSDLKYISDNSDDYMGMVPENLSNYSNKDLIELMKVIEDDGDLESVLNVDSFLKYLAMSTVTIHLDTYQSGMFHNYYLYNNNGIFEWITWDLNSIYNKFPMTGLTDEEATKFLIDEPVIGEMEKYPLIKAIFKNDEYVKRYHDYINVLINGYLAEENVENKVLSIYEMIKDYVKTDPTAFFTYEQFEEALFVDTDTHLSLLNFITKRNDNIEKQLEGTIVSTNNGLGNNGASGKGGMPPMGMEGTNGQPKRGDDSQVPPMDNQDGIANRKGNEGRQGMIGGLPPGMTMEDLPEEIRSYMERGEMPSMDKMRELMKDMPEGMFPMGMQPQAIPINMERLIPNLVLLLIGIIGIVGFTHYLRKLRG